MQNMQSKHFLIAATGVVILLALTGIYRVVRPHDDFSYTPPASEPAGHGIVGNAKLDTDPYDVLITYTDDGFSPRDITIEKGQRVRFLNESSDEFWPAVGIHPTHTLYPEKEREDCLGSSFDACAALKKGEFFDFTLYYLGDWPVHDHLHGYNTGSVTVTAR